MGKNNSNGTIRVPFKTIGYIDSDLVEELRKLEEEIIDSKKDNGFYLTEGIIKIRYPNYFETPDIFKEKFKEGLDYMMETYQNQNK